MARLQVADGGDGLQLWRVAANILNKQSLTADKGSSSSLLRNVRKGLGLRRIVWINELRERRKIRWAWLVARMREERNAYRTLAGKPEGKRPLGLPRRR
jgi:hypothetical protein